MKAAHAGRTFRRYETATFTRDHMADVEWDRRTELDRVAAGHHNTDNPPPISKMLSRRIVSMPRILVKGLRPGAGL